MSYARGVPHIGHTEGQAMFDQEQHPFVRSGGPSFRPDLPSGRAPRAAAVKDAAAKAAPAEPARSVLDRASTVLNRSGRGQGGTSECMPAALLRPWARSPSGERKMNSCVWCERQFNPRRSGGRSQRFCRPSCRRAFHAAARAWVLRAIARGALTVPDLRTDAMATRALLLGTISRALVP